MILQAYRSFETFFIHSWWVILFFLVCYVCYEHGLYKRDQDFAKLHSQYLDLQKEKLLAGSLHADLTLQINSQSDPDYVELVLMKGLGLVGEGQTKVLFRKDEG